MASTATIRFLGDWHQEQYGAIERGRQLKIDYDPERLPRCFINWRGAEFGNIVVYLRFHPRGEIVGSSVIAPVLDRENPPGMVIGHRPAPFELAIPDDATQAEIWFHNFYQTSSRCDAWDSRFAENYWFDIDGAPPRIPAQQVSYRSGALTRPDIVNVLEQNTTKVNVFPSSAASNSRPETNLQPMLKVVAWVKETIYGANAWIDVHIFDDQDELIYAETLTLHYTGYCPVFRYEYSGPVNQGSTPAPGSTQGRLEARKANIGCITK
jgi:hypothetical protein